MAASPTPPPGEADPEPSPWRYALVGAVAGYLVGVVLAVPVAAVAFGEATTTTAHRADLWAFAFAGGVFGAVVGALAGARSARRASSDAADGAP